MASPAPTDHDRTTSPRSDLVGGLVWVTFGCAILIASLRMDRLENQDVNPYTVPGLLPGLLGIAIMLMGALLAVRSWREGGRIRMAGGTAMRRPKQGALQLVLVLALCLIFGTMLVGNGLPFWLAASLFVSVSIIVLQRASRQAASTRLGARSVATAAAIGFAAGVGITAVFQDIFLVHLP